jgi:hypothetical protein
VPDSGSQHALFGLNWRQESFIFSLRNSDVERQSKAGDHEKIYSIEMDLWELPPIDPSNMNSAIFLLRVTVASPAGFEPALPP